MTTVPHQSETTESLPTSERPDHQPLDRRRTRAERARTPIGRLLRYGGLAVGALVGWSFGGLLAARPELIVVSQLFLAATLASLGFLATPYIVFDVVDALVERLRTLTLEALLIGTAGGVAGATLGLLLAWPLALLPPPASQLVPSLVALLTTTLGALLAHSKQHEILAALGRTGYLPGTPSILDTSALIDGRVRAVLRLGWLDGPVLVPAEVIRELHHLSDSSDPARSARGRHGLEVLRRLREELGARCRVLEEYVPPRTTDEAVLARCREHNGRLVTCDQRLAEVARVRDLVALNPHQLADALRAAVRTGDRLTLRLAGPGREPEQAVGYLEDGTLVIVERAQSLIGHEVTVEVTRLLQTTSGRLVFGQLVRQEDPR